MKNLTLVIPAKKESESLPVVMDELQKYNCKKLIVLSKSDIETINSIKSYNCEILLQKNEGYGAAIIEGINKADTEYMCIFNADGSFLPDDLNEMLKISEQSFDFVFASRYSLGGKTDDDTIITFIGNKIFTLLGKIFFNLKIDDILYTYVLGKTDSFRNLKLENLDFRFCVELPVKVKRREKKYTNFGSSERKRFKGEKKVNEFRDGFLILLELIFMFLFRRK